MVWPRTRVSPDPLPGHTYDGTIVGSFYHRSRIVRFLWQLEPEERFKVLKDLDGYRHLSQDVLRKLSLLTLRRARRLVQAYRALEDCILISTPELTNRPATSLLWRLWRWCISTIVHSYDEFHSKWKAFSLHVKHSLSKTENRFDNRIPNGFPGGHYGHLGSLWTKSCPWILDIYLKTGDKLNKRLIERVATICQTRNFPPPDLSKKRFDQEVDSWRAQLTAVPPWNMELRLRVFPAIGKVVSVVSNRLTDRPRPHVSLAASACFEKARKDGGRMIHFLATYIENYVQKSNNLDFLGETVWGAPYFLKKGYPKAYTMCRKKHLSNRISSFLSSAFLTDTWRRSPITVMCSGADSKVSLEEPIFGLDRETPLQFLQLAFECLVDLGIFKGPYYREPNLTFDKRRTKVRVFAKAHPVAEPGNKLRWVTMEPACAGIFLQPFARWLAHFAKQHPSLTSAFTRTYKGWDYSIMLQTMDGKHHPDYGIGVFDLTGASNQLSKPLCRLIAERFILEFTRVGSPEQDYLFLALDLLLRERYIMVFETEDQDREYHRAIIQTNGLLMGNPGTKELLCLVSAVLFQMSCDSGPEFGLTLIAGDDNGVYSTHRHFKRLLRLHREYGNVINTSKTMWSPYANFFCEEALQLVPNAVGCGKPPWMLDYNAGIHVDVIKLRLLSPFGIQSLHDHSWKNPAVGKGSALNKVLAWYPRCDVKRVAIYRYRSWMADYCQDPLCLLPRILGGHGIPLIETPEEVFKKIERVLPPYLWSVYARVLTDGVDYSSILDLLMRRMANGGAVRGIYDPLAWELTAQYGVLGSMAFSSESKLFSEFESELKVSKPYSGPRDVMRHIRKSGYMGHHDIVDLLDRITGIRAGFAAAAGLFDLDDILMSRNEGVTPSPTNVARSFWEHESQVLRRHGFNAEELKPRPSDYITVRRCLMKERWDDFVLRRKQLFIPKGAIYDSLNGMTVHLPYQAPVEDVPGVHDDPQVEPQQGWISNVISINRL